jgi:Tfp pilus assembly protein FimT
MKAHAGASLLELIVVIACGGILVAIAVPNVEQLQREWMLWGAAHMVESSLQWGRMHAVAANCSVLFEVNPDGRGYHWADTETGAPFEESRRTLPGRVRIVSSPHRPLRFYPRANAAPAGTFVIQGDAGQYSVIVSVAGRIRLQRN